MPTRILELYISPAHNYFGHHGRAPSQHPMLGCRQIRCLAGRGIEGDRFLDFKPHYKGQITFFEHEVYQDLCASLHIAHQSTSVFRRNVITAGLCLPTLIGQEFELQGVRFLGKAECAPCQWMESAFGKGAEAALAGRGGLRATILCDGLLRCEKQ